MLGIAPLSTLPLSTLPSAGAAPTPARHLAHLLPAVAMVALGFFPSEEIRATKHDLNAFRSPAAAAADGHVVQQHNQIRLTRAEIQPPQTDHANRLFFGRSAQAVSQPFFITQPPVRPPDSDVVDWRPKHDNLHLYRQAFQTVGQPWATWAKYTAPAFDTEQIKQPLADLFPYRQFAPVTPPSAGQSFWAWSTRQVVEFASEDIARPIHDLNSYRRVAIVSSGHVVQQHTQVRVTRIEPQPVLQDHSNRLFFGRATLTAGPGQPWYCWKPILGWVDPEEQMFRTNHDLALYPFRPHDAITPPAATGHVIQQHTQVRLTRVDPHPPQYNHGNRLFFGREQVEAQLTQPYWLWKYKPTVLDTEEIRQPKHDLNAYRQTAPITVEWTAYGVPYALPPPEEIRQPKHDLNAFRNIAAPVLPGQPWYCWKPVLGWVDPEEQMFRTNHDLALYPFRPHDAIVPPAATGHVIQQHTQVRLTRVDPHPPQYNHGNRLFFGRAQVEAQLTQPYWLWKYKPTVLDTEEIRQPKHDLNAYRQTAPITVEWTAYGVPYALPPPEEIRQPKHDLNAFRNIAAPVLPGQPWYCWKPVLGWVDPEEQMFRTNHDLALYPFRPHDAITPTVEDEHRSRRHGLRQIQEGYVVPPGVESRSELGTARGKTTKRVLAPGVAAALGFEGGSEVGFVVARDAQAAKAIPGGLRPVRGTLGEVVAHAGGHAVAAGFECVSRLGRCVPRVPANVKATLPETEATLGDVKAMAIINPTREEIIALVAAVRARRNR